MYDYAHQTKSQLERSHQAAQLSTKLMPSAIQKRGRDFSHVSQPFCSSYLSKRLSSPSITTVLQRAVLTRAMHNISQEADTKEELGEALKQANYSNDIASEIIHRWLEKHSIAADEHVYAYFKNGYGIEIEKFYGGEEPSDEVDESYETQVAELVLNDTAHGGGLYAEYLLAEGTDPIQAKRTPNSMSGPKDFTTSNSGDFEDSFYILGGSGEIDFETLPTKAAHTAHVPPGKRKKTPLKHANITWTDPHSSGSKADSLINLNDHPDVKSNAVTIDTDDRPQHFRLADYLYAKKKGWKFASDTSKFRNGKWTWHHLATQYHMVLVDMEVHAKHGHNGGVFLW
ncbi:hypothetical protein PA25_05320 [Pseudoalteromonas sp. A25]|uniref:HNH endonuclease n=1 Tax=Pseudoalteromonas sp. A25 TaxID=116092 RepID=UPI0012606CC8|nr:HNH endonuclease [Pseudoalteromonas sp. A25]BBN80547.1 hypothetical protein PA25_05320 [Pseudoalteromonas sp. A25]